MESSDEPGFNFVNIQHPDDLKDGETQLRIRRLAMREVGKARRRPKNKGRRNQIVLELRGSPHPPASIDHLGSGRIDPFIRLPIELDDNARALLANIFDPESLHASQLRGSWFPVGLESPAAFHNMLANSQYYFFQKSHGYFPSRNTGQALIHHQRALGLARKLLADPAKQTSNEALGTIASFICHHAILANFAGGEWNQHQHALLKIIALRGGLHTVDQDHIRITISCGDLIGSFAQDIPPSIPLPRKWELDSRPPPGARRPRSAIALMWKQQLPTHLDWVTIFDDIVQLISLDGAFNKQQLELATTSGSWIEPTIHRLLAIRPLALGNNRGNVIEEVCRLGTLLFLTSFWRVLGQSPVHTLTISRNLQIVLLQYKTEWHELMPLLAWTLYHAAVETADPALRSQFVFMLAVVVSGMQIQGWEEFLAIVKSVLWVDSLAAGSDDLIREQVMQILGDPTSALAYRERLKFHEGA